MKKPLSSLLPALAGYELLSDTPAARAVLDRSVTMLCYDSRKAHDLSLFFCLTGTQSDGHRYAPAAYRAGARAFVVEHPVELPADALQIQVPDTRCALADGAAAFYDHPEREIQLVGITGTKGKTTTAQMAVSVLNRCGIPTGYIGTNGVEFAGMHFPTVNSTPESLVIYHYLRYMLEEGIRVCVMEVSSQALWKHRVRGLTFSVCLFTNLSPDHIGGVEHPSLAHYAACKHSLLTDYGARLVICNADDPVAADMMQGVTARSVFFSTSDKPDNAYPQHPPVRWRASQISPERRGDRLGVRFTCTRDGHAYAPRFLPLPGPFNVQNALGALAICRDGFGLRTDTILDCLENMTVPGRFEVITSPHLPGVTFVIDYAHNGASLASTLDALRAFSPTRLICLFGSVGERTVGRRRDMALAAAYRADLCILTSDNPGSEPPEHIIGQIDAAFPPDACPRLSVPDRAEAIRTAVNMARPGDIILLAGKGHENYQLVGTRSLPFCEREILEEALSSRKEAKSL